MSTQTKNEVMDVRNPFTTNLQFDLHRDNPVCHMTINFSPITISSSPSWHTSLNLLATLYPNESY